MNVGMLSVRHDAASAAVVRAEIAADLRAHRVTDDSVHDVVLVVSELVGNAVVHSAASSDLDVAWDVADGTVTVRVKDDSPVVPQARNVAPDSTSGRGLAIVAAVAAEWGVHRATVGKSVWARVPVHQAI